MHSFLQVIVKRLVSTIRLQSWGLIECIDNEIYGNSTTGSHGITDILLGIYAKRSIQIYILIFSFIFLSEIVCSVVRICIQIFVYFSDFFSFIILTKTVSMFDMALLICFHLDAMFLHIVRNQIPKSCL